jgi:hypothetical protein
MVRARKVRHDEFECLMILASPGSVREIHQKFSLGRQYH